MDTALRPVNVLWLIDLEPSAGMHHGGHLRWFAFSRELLARGHTVYFSINQQPADQADAKRRYLEELQRARVLSGYIETRYGFPRWIGKAAHLLVYPTLTNWLLAAFQTPTVATLTSVIAAYSIDALVVSDRALLFVVPRLRNQLPVIIDWADSFVLYQWRQTRVYLKQRALARLLHSLKRLAQAFVQERYYGRRSVKNIVVSPVDKQYLDTTTGTPEANRVVLNGTQVGAAREACTRTRTRLIFTGAMNFPPNYEAAIWFIDSVLPRILVKRPDVSFVVAGRDPTPDLLRRAGPGVIILGAVDDIQHEIGCSGLYVAPLVSGSGFKNKVVEALGAGTFVVGTTLAVEFLPASIRDRLLVADTADALAQVILRFLSDPDQFQGQVASLVEVLRREFSWAQRTADLLRILCEAVPPESQRP